MAVSANLFQVEFSTTSTNTGGRSVSGAPSSSLSVQTFTGPATHGTPRDRLAHVLIDLMDDDERTVPNAILSPTQKALCDLCKQDLLASCQAYEESWGLHQGQQFLTDLKRMENVLHKLLAVQGDHTHLPTNVYVIAQALTSRLTNPKNLCFGNSAFRCTLELGRSTCGRSGSGMGPRTGSSAPISVGHTTSLRIWRDFQEGHQDDGRLRRTLTRFCRWHLLWWQILSCDPVWSPVNMICPPGDSPITLEEIVNQWADEEGGQYLYGTRGGSSFTSSVPCSPTANGQNMTDSWTSTLASPFPSLRTGFIFTVPPTRLSASFYTKAMDMKMGIT